MKAAGFLAHATDLVETDFSKLAEAVGILGLRAERPEQVKTILNQALEHEGPALVDVAVNRQELLVPPSINLEQIKGFTLYMIKAILNGKGDEVVDLARTNLFM
jgi:pyruvate dehydrogenase (quinone)